jgi:putative methyltransferase (TIGR04325 family)
MRGSLASGCAPITLFCYKRPEHLRRVVSSLQANAECGSSPLIIFCDGPRSAEDEGGVKEVRELVRAITGFASVEVVIRERNLGLADSVISGVTDVLARYGKIIVLEDDTVVSKYFLKYMNDALSLYCDDERVISIHGYLPPLGKQPKDCFFLRGADCWGWATWSRGWSEFRPDGQQLLDELVTKQLVESFDLDGAYPYTAMLEEWTQGRNDSWAIRWHASAYLKGRLTLYPQHSLVVNIGNDGSGTHSADSTRYATNMSETALEIRPVPVEQDNRMRLAFGAFYDSAKAPKGAMRRLLWKAGIVKAKKKIKKWKERYGWFKTALPWHRAVDRCAGYDSNIILEKCKNSLIQVKQGTAVYERDSVLFDQVEYSWPLLAGLMTAATHGGGRLRVLDVGGSLGSTYFQNKKFLDCLQDVEWNIVEQPQFVACGESYFQDERLKFHSTIEQCMEAGPIDAILIASTVQYVESPYELLNKIARYRIPFILFDRTAFSNNNTDLVSIQKVSPEIYRASYPSWFLSRSSFMDVFMDDYDLIESFFSLNHPVKLQDGKKVIECPEEGFIFARKGIRHA